MLFGAAGGQQSLELLTDVVYEDIAAKLSLPGAILDYSQPSVIEAILRGAVFRSGVHPARDQHHRGRAIIAASNSAYDALAFSSYANGEAFLHDMLKIKKVMLGDAATALRGVGEGTQPIARRHFVHRYQSDKSYPGGSRGRKRHTSGHGSGRRHGP